MTQMSSTRVRGSNKNKSSSSISALRMLIFVVLGCIGIARVFSPENIEVNVPTTTESFQQSQGGQTAGGSKPSITQHQPMQEIQKPPTYDEDTRRQVIEKPITEPTDSQATQDSDEDGDSDGDSDDEDEQITEPPESSPTEPPTPKSSLASSTTATSTTTTCQRHCPKKRINRIFFHNKPAGLLDRELTYHVMSNLAGYLCALVEIPRPSVSLQAVHNGGKSVSEDLTWMDFFNMTFLEDGSPSLLDVKENPKFAPDFRYWGTSGTYKQADYPGWKIVVTSKKDNMTTHYQELQEFSFQQSPDAETGFIWEIHKPYFKSELRKSDTLPDLPEDLQETLGSAYSPSMRPFLRWSPSNVTGCNYVNDDQYQLSPTQLEPIREAIRNKVRSLAPANTSVFGFFHIRRGDGMKSCNTSLPVLKEFFDCSLKGTEETGKHITFLLGSDEHDEEYRQAVMDLAKDLPHVSMLDADKLVDSMMQEMAQNGQMPERYMNNYHQFEFLKTLGMDRKFHFSSVHLIRRRNVDCEECTNLLETYPDVWS